VFYIQSFVEVAKSDIGHVLKVRHSFSFPEFYSFFVITFRVSLLGIPKGNGISVIGKGVEISNEILLRSVVVLPHKSVSENTENKIIL
jgi:hypothetical protein